MYGARSSTMYGDLYGELATVTIDNHTADTTVLTGGAGDDIIFSAETYFDPNNSDRLVGGGGSDWMFGNDGFDVLDGGAGDDFMHGGAGLDMLDFSDASSAVTFTLVQAQLNYWAVDLTAFGLGIDCYSSMEGVIGSAFGDTLTGSGEADLIDGGAGDDGIDGGAGNDNLIGGAGNDIFTFADGCGQDGIFDFAAGAESDDVLDITAFGFADFSAIMAATTNINGNAVIALDADDSITLLGVTADQLHLNDFYFL
jgi:Ca2+-binding RTX toxin-like protein